MNKKALTFWFMIEIVTGLVAGIMIAYIAPKITSLDIYQQSKVSREVALMLDTVPALSGNLIYHYPVNLSRYELVFKDNLFTVSYAGGDYAPQSWPYVLQENLDVSLDEPGSLIFGKDDGRIFVAEEGKLPATRRCPKVDTSKEFSRVQIVVDPGHGGTDTGFVEGSLKEAAIVRVVSSVLQQKIPLLQSTRDLTTEMPVEMEERRSKVTSLTDVVLSLHGTYYREDGDFARAYVNKVSPNFRKSVKLACTILNGFTIGGWTLLPLNASELSDNDPRKILDHEQVGVVLELGNMQYADTMLKNPVKVADQLYNGLVKYFG